MRKPKQYAVSRPGDLVEVDTLDVRPVPGVLFKPFTARDVVSRRDVIQAVPASILISTEGMKVSPIYRTSTGSCSLPLNRDKIPTRTGRLP